MHLVNCYICAIVTGSLLVPAVPEVVEARGSRGGLSIPCSLELLGAFCLYFSLLDASDWCLQGQLANWLWKVICLWKEKWGESRLAKGRMCVMG